MSRIEEAFRRTTSGAVEAESGSRRDTTLIEKGLDAYPLESRSPRRVGAGHAIRSRVGGNDANVPRIVVATRAGGRGQLPTFPAALEGKIVASRDIPQETVEQYRRLAGALHNLQTQRGLKTLLVSSSLPREGKTLTITNLALTLSESYQRRVLLIDADLRHPSVHDVFGFPNGVGLADVLRSGDGSLPVVEVSPCLSVLTAGHPEPNPMAQLTSDRLRTVVANAAERFDWVLLDTPPVGLLTDAQLIARVCEGVLFVIGAGVTPYSLVQRGIAELGADRIVGVVLNRVEAQKLPHNGYYAHYYLQGDVETPQSH
jgi:capsular exopolysaccharide synthesis family protein